MIELVNKFHPDKQADRIAGALVDLAYKLQKEPKIAVEVLLGHGTCHIISESSIHLPVGAVAEIVCRIAGPDVDIDYKDVPQDEELARNQEGEVRCGDNGIFKGMPLTNEQQTLSEIRSLLEDRFPSDGKYLLDDKTKTIVICQSKAGDMEIRRLLKDYKYGIIVNPLGYWTGGTNVDTGATNRKLGSDMGDSITGGGLHGKDLSKGDVSINIYCWLLAQQQHKPIEAFCAIGDTEVNVDGNLVPYNAIVEAAGQFVQNIGGFEKLAEHGLL